ncbi:DUF3822 family protein [Ilyomonas limi]|uniref:DUF3822 family protein n=2 Tax=Ilyomonas limi TaxID=2575867 RepID=A0A4U3L6V3_9BACT|nr:DUF3822 family protein [Ilyomonas limi]
MYPDAGTIYLHFQHLYISILMVQKLFSIYFTPDETNALFIEIGHHHIACWCTGDKQSLQAFEYFTFHTTDEHEDFEKVYKVAKLHSVLLNNEFAATEVIWETTPFTCVPNALFKPEVLDDYINMLDKSPFTKALSCTQRDITVAYPVKEDALRLVQHHFPKATASHKICQLSKELSGNAVTALHTIFYHHHFLLLAVKDNALQLATSIAYQSSQDCLYYILYTMQQLNLPLNETVVLVSGFIDMNSALYKELYQYIPLLQPAEKGMLKDEYPAHYFTTFYK